MRTLLITAVITVVTMIGFAQTTSNVEDAIRFSNSQGTTILEQTQAQIPGHSSEGVVVLENRSNSQLEEMGSRLGYSR